MPRCTACGGSNLRCCDGKGGPPRKHNPGRAAIHVWNDRGAYFWDDAEDHGGFDRNSPTGPFHDEASAIDDAASCFGIQSTQFAEIHRDLPDRYAP